MKRNKQGFTLVETLAALLILSLLTAVIAMGTTTAVGIYRDSLFVSESGILRSTLNTALSDVLRYAAFAETVGEGDVSITNPNYGLFDGRILLEDGKLRLESAASDEGDLLWLVSDGAYTTLQLRDFTLAYEDGLFQGSYVITDRDGKRESPVTFAFRALNGAVG